MSSTPSTVCQGLQSCLEPILLEPRVLMHQLTPSKQGLSIPHPQKPIQIPPRNSNKPCPVEKMCEGNRNNGQESNSCWSFLQSLTNSSCSSLQSNDETKQVYVHPLARRSTSCLSSRSLEMCTESLGSETGSDIGSNINEFFHYGFEKQSGCGINPAKNRVFCKQVKQSSSFPPPLTSISGGDGVQVQTHREGGRLVIKAYNLSSCNGYFHAERENGRLRISLFKDAENEEEEQELEHEEEQERENVDEIDDDEVDFNGSFWGEDGGKVGCKIGGGGGGRCNGDGGGSKRMPSLPYWSVAIS